MSSVSGAWLTHEGLLEETMSDVLQAEASGAAKSTLLTFLLPRRPTVLLAEGDERERDALVLLLTAIGFHALEARDAAEVLELVRTDPAIDILLAGDTLPGLPMAELVAAAQALSRRLTYVVMSSGGGVPGIPPAHLLARPFGPEALRRALDRLLRGASGDREPSRLQ